MGLKYNLLYMDSSSCSLFLIKKSRVYNNLIKNLPYQFNKTRILILIITYIRAIFRSVIDGLRKKFLTLDCLKTFLNI